jgi:hypothetical protein
MPRLICALTLGATALALWVSAASAAGQSGPAAGTGTLGPDTITSVQADGPNLVVEGTTTGVVDGTFNATFTETFREVVHQDGSVNLTGTLVFTGSTPCGVGTWTQQLVGRAESDGTFSGQSTTIDQGKSTVDLTTEYSFVGAGNTFTYSGQYRCP